MKKIVAALMALLVTTALAACSGAGDMKGFLEKAEGDWYFCGNSADALMRVYEDGTWEYYAPRRENGGDRLEWGIIEYNSEYKIYDFIDENSGISYSCELDDGVMLVKGGSFVAAEESRDLAERFDGNWYLDGDENNEHYEFASGEWKFWKGYSSSDSGVLMYRGGDKKTLTCIDFYADEPFDSFTIVSDDELKTKSGRIFKHVPTAVSHSDPEEDGGFVPEQYRMYYKNGDLYSARLCFYFDGTVDYDAPGEDTREGSYAADGPMITITWSGTDDETALSIESDGSLTDEQGGSYSLYDE